MPTSGLIIETPEADYPVAPLSFYVASIYWKKMLDNLEKSTIKEYISDGSLIVEACEGGQKLCFK